MRILALPHTPEPHPRRYSRAMCLERIAHAKAQLSALVERDAPFMVVKLAIMTWEQWETRLKEATE